MKRTIFLLWLVLVLACKAGEQSEVKQPEYAPPVSATATAQTAPAPIIDIPKLAGKSPDAIDAALGKPSTVTPITSSAAQMPGEFRAYKVGENREVLTIRFFRGRAVHFTFDLPQVTETPNEALRLVGIDVDDTQPTIKAPMAVRWSGSFGGIEFKDVAALKNIGSSGFSIVQAEVSP